MISVNVLVDHKKWKKSLNKPQLFFDKILERFPKKYFYSNKKDNPLYDYPTVREGHRGMRFIDAVIESSDKKKWIKI